MEISVFVTGQQPNVSIAPQPATASFEVSLAMGPTWTIPSGATSMTVVEAPTVPERDRRESSWVHANLSLLKRDFSGEWIVIHEDCIISHSPELPEAVTEARGKGIRTPYLFYVEEE